MRVVAVSVLLVLVGAAAHAAVVYGSLTRGGEPLVELELTITCASEPYPGKTDDKGSYSINVTEQGRCTLAIEFEGQRVEAPVYSQEQPARHDFELIREGDEWKLRRK